MVNASTGLPFVGAVTCYVTIDGGTQTLGSVGSGVCTAEGNGYYTYFPAQTETNGVTIAFTFIGAGAVPVTVQVFTVTATQSTAIALATNPNVTPLVAVNLITNAFVTIGVLGAGDVADGSLIQDGFRRLNNMMGQLAIQPKTIPVTAREVFTLTSGKGGPGNEYTIGPGGDFNTSRPATLLGAGLLLGGSSPTLEIPRAVITDDGWQNIRIKDLQSPLFTDVYYNTTFANGLGTINLWPVPNTAANSLVIYRQQQLGVFPSLTATYYVPNGYDEMLEYNLAVRLAGPYRRTLPPYVQQMAIESLAIAKRANYRLVDLPQDPALTTNNRGGYNILTGQGSGN